jgi:hypothetical protein
MNVNFSLNFLTIHLIVVLGLGACNVTGEVGSMNRSASVSDETSGVPEDSNTNGGSNYNAGLPSSTFPKGPGYTLSEALGVIAATQPDLIADLRPIVAMPLPRPDDRPGTPAPASADILCNGGVGMGALKVLLASWGAKKFFPRADIDGDGRVGTEDLGILLSQWNGIDGTFGNLVADVNHDCLVDGADLGAVLSDRNSTPLDVALVLSTMGARAESWGLRLADFSRNGRVDAEDLSIALTSNDPVAVEMVLASWDMNLLEYHVLDLNRDRLVNPGDVTVMQAAVGSSYVLADLNIDGVIDGKDLAIFLNQYERYLGGDMTTETDAK